MTHYTEDELILYYYAEERRAQDIGRHLTVCAECSATYRSIAQTLRLVAAPDVPARGDSYAREVWARIRPGLPERSTSWWPTWFRWNVLAAAAAVASVVLASFVTARVWPRDASTRIQTVSPIDAEAGERIRLAAIGDHLERSERVLLDLVNADSDRINLSDDQAWAAELIDSNRLFRETAAQAQDSLIAGVLEELERSLLEVVHGPSTPTPAEFEAVRTRLDAADLLFKVRVLADELHEREMAPVQPRKTT